MAECVWAFRNWYCRQADSNQQNLLTYIDDLRSLSSKVENSTFKMSDIFIAIRLVKSLRFPPPYSLVPLVYLSVYPSSPSSAALSLNFAPAEKSSFMFLIEIAISENGVVIYPVRLFLAIVMTEITSEIRAMPKAVHKM